VARALNGDAQVVSVAATQEARRALTTRDFDLVVVDLASDRCLGRDLLPELHNSAGLAIPVIVYSARAENPICAAQVRAALAKSRGSMDSLIATLRKRVVVPAFEAPDERDPA